MSLKLFVFAAACIAAAVCRAQIVTSNESGSISVGGGASDGSFPPCNFNSSIAWSTWGVPISHSDSCTSRRATGSGQGTLLMSKPTPASIHIQASAGGGGGGLGGFASGSGSASGSFTMLLPTTGTWSMTGTASSLMNGNMSVTVRRNDTVLYTSSVSGPGPALVSFAETNNDAGPWTISFSCGGGSGNNAPAGQCNMSFDIVATALPGSLPASYIPADPSSHAPVWQNTMAWCSRTSQFVSFGGQTAAGDYSAQSAVWNGATWTPATVPAGLVARADHAVCEVPGGDLILVGGQAQGHVLRDDAWKFGSSGTWQPYTLAFPGGPRAGHAMAFDRARSRAVVFGGFTNAPGGVSFAFANPETWTFSGTAWTLAATAGPPPRFAHAMAYDESRSRVVLFGGLNESGMLADTWEWDGTAWIQVPAPGPSPRYYHSLQWDASRGGVLLVGGRNGPEVYADQWLFTANGWTHLPDDFLGGPVWAHAAATSSQGSMLLAGGVDGDWSVRSDTFKSTLDPVITAQPTPWTGFPGDTAAFDVSALGGSLTYQWKRDGTPLVNNARVSGATSPHLVITSIQPGDVGAYTCTITNPAGSSTTAAAALGIMQCDTIDFNRDGLLPDTADIDDFLTVFSGGLCSNDPLCGDIDFNNDGLLPDTADIDTLLRVFSGGPCGG